VSAVSKLTHERQSFIERLLRGLLFFLPGPSGGSLLGGAFFAAAFFGAAFFVAYTSSVKQGFRRVLLDGVRLPRRRVLLATA